MDTVVAQRQNQGEKQEKQSLPLSTSLKAVDITVKTVVQMVVDTN